MSRGHHRLPCSCSSIEEEGPTPRLCKCLDSPGILGSPPGLGALSPYCLVWMACTAHYLLEKIRSHPGSRIAWFALILCGHRCWPCFRCKQILLLGPLYLYHSSLYTKVYFALKLLASLSVFRTDSAEMETSSFLFSSQAPGRVSYITRDSLHIRQVKEWMKRVCLSLLKFL